MASENKQEQVFVAYDFAIVEGSLFTNVMERVEETQPPNIKVRWAGAPGALPQGEIWKATVRPGIDEAARVFAFVDLPNANVGFEVGYAIGKGKPVAVGRFLDRTHPWHEEPPLRAVFRHRLARVEEILKAVQGDFMTSKGEPRRGDGVLVLCPHQDGDVFLPLIKQMGKSQSGGPSWRPWENRPWGLDDLPARLAGIGKVVWLIVPQTGDEGERDGTENATLSIVAGYAAARQELDLVVLRHQQARIVADVEGDANLFTSNQTLRDRLSEIDAEWRNELARRKAPARPPASTRTPQSRRPDRLEPHPPDNWAEAEARFIGRRVVLNDAAEAVEGLVFRQRERREASGSRSVKLIWVYGFGGMGKTWFLHRARLQASAAVPSLCSLIIDFDPRPENSWRQPLGDAPRTAEDLFDLVAYRLAQRVSLDGAEPYWKAKGGVEAAAGEHKRLYQKFLEQLTLAKSDDSNQVDPDMRRLLRDACGRDKLWELPAKERASFVARCSDDLTAVRDLFERWAGVRGERDDAVVRPEQVLAEGLRAALQAAARDRPLLLLLDTAELLSPELQFWLRQLLTPLLRAPEALLVLLGTRLRPDVDQRPGSRRGWREELPAGSLRVQAFAEDLCFSVEEIENSLSALSRKLKGSGSPIAEQLHRVTLGVPLAVRTLLDLHEQGGDVLRDLAKLEVDSPVAAGKDAVRYVITVTAERLLLHLADNPAREHDYRDVCALALLRVTDPAVLRCLWDQGYHARLLELGGRYSLLAEGDLHPTVRESLRRHWRRPSARPSFFDELLAKVAAAVAQLSPPDPPPRDPSRFVRLVHELDVRAWRDDGRILNELARALCLTMTYDLDSVSEALVDLLQELTWAGVGDRPTQQLWQSSEPLVSRAEEVVGWLRQCHDSGRDWTPEESAALSTCEGVTGTRWGMSLPKACAKLELLEQAVAGFGLEQMPQRAAVGEAFFWVARSLDESEEHLGRSIAAFERAQALGCRPAAVQSNLGMIYSTAGRYQEAESSFRRAIELDPKNAYPHDGLGNLYQYCLRIPEEAERRYLKAIELDPKFAHPHNALGNLYQYRLSRPEEAERCYLKAIELDPKFALPYAGLGDLYQDDPHRSEEAERCFLKAIELNPKLAFPHSGLGNLYQYELSRPEEAERSYLKAIELDPKSDRPHAGLASLFESAGDWERARGAANREAELEAPHEGGGPRSLAWIELLSDGDPATASRYLDAARIKEPKHPGAGLLDAACALWHGEAPKSRDVFQRWSTELAASEAWFIWFNRSRTAALLRKAQSFGAFEDFASIVCSLADRPWWRPWAEALEVARGRRELDTLSDVRARELYDLLQGPRAGAAGPPTTGNGSNDSR